MSYLTCPNGHRFEKRSLHSSLHGCLECGSLLTSAGEVLKKAQFQPEENILLQLDHSYTIDQRVFKVIGHLDLYFTSSRSHWYTLIDTTGGLFTLLAEKKGYALLTSAYNKMTTADFVGLELDLPIANGAQTLFVTAFDKLGAIRLAGDSILIQHELHPFFVYLDEPNSNENYLAIIDNQVKLRYFRLIPTTIPIPLPA